jgi:membrane associated rhomboid family serine protease
MRRYPSRSPSYSSFSFGPGPLSPAIKAIIATNVVLFLAAYVFPELITVFGLRPSDVVFEGRIWQVVTYMFLHGNIGHILFNMLALWMFGTELERLWGTRAFVRYYGFVGAAAALSTILVSSIVPVAARTFYTTTIGASGAIYGLLLAYGLLFPNRPIMLYFVFPIPAKYFVMILGAIALLMSVSDSGGGVAHITHMGGLVAGYLLLRGRNLSPANEVRYRYLRWKMDRARKKFGVYSGGRKDDWDKRIH